MVDARKKDSEPWERLGDQLSAGRTSSRWVATLLLAAAVTVLAAIGAPAALSASLAASIVVVEGSSSRSSGTRTGSPTGQRGDPAQGAAGP